MALVPHIEDKEGKKAFDEKIAKAKKSGAPADRDKLQAENNVHLDGKPAPKVEVTNK